MPLNKVILYLKRLYRDYTKKHLLLKRGVNQGLLPETLSIGPNMPLGSAKLILNIYKFIDAVINGEKNK